MRKAGKRPIEALEEAVATTNGESSAGGLTIDGKTFRLGDEVRDNYAGAILAKGQISFLPLPNTVSNGPVFVKLEEKEQPESFYADELICNADAWEVL